MPDAHAAGSRRVGADRAAEPYERLRDRCLDGRDYAIGPAGVRFARCGLAGLLEPDPLRGYVVEIHEARAAWWERVDPGLALQDALRVIVGPPASVAP